jgi:Fis family transcriptional regulator, factor for inversion stimulation protein
MNLDSVEIIEEKESSFFEIHTQQNTLRESVEQAMKNYFSQLEDQTPSDIYELVMAEVEAPLMECVMAYTNGNQTKASTVLGLNRGTLRKKLKMYGLN